MNNRHSILIVEDDALQAMDLELALQEAGFTVIGPASTSASALALIDDGVLDGAVLDYNLAEGTSLDVAVRLRSEGVPFVYVTGQMGELLANEAAPRAEIFQKPYIQSELLRFIGRRIMGCSS